MVWLLFCLDHLWRAETGLRLREEVRGDWTLVKPHTSSRTHLGGLKTVDREKVCPELSLDENNKAVM